MGQECVSQHGYCRRNMRLPNGEWERRVEGTQSVRLFQRTGEDPATHRSLIVKVARDTTINRGLDESRTCGEEDGSDIGSVYSATYLDTSKECVRLPHYNKQPCRANPITNHFTPNFNPISRSDSKMYHNFHFFSFFWNGLHEAMPSRELITQ